MEKKKKRKKERNKRKKTSFNLSRLTKMWKPKSKTNLGHTYIFGIDQEQQHNLPEYGNANFLYIINV